MYKPTKLSKIVLFWFHDYKKQIILVHFFVVICVILSKLSKISLFPILYGYILFAFIGMCMSVISIHKYKKRYEELMCAQETLANSLDFLPKPSTKMEEQYLARIVELYEDRSRLYYEIQKRERDEQDYYTLWIHQIKTPIAAMRLVLQSRSAQSENDSQGERNSLVLEQELFRIEQYAQMALHYLHLQSMSSDFVLKKYSLYEIVKKEVKKYSVSFIEKKLSLEFEEFDKEFVTDEKWFGFVVEQILSNCIKYTNKGTITICYEEQGLECKLMIRDTGIGILEEDIPRIFERGYTGLNGRIDQHSTGIGLYLCKEVLDRLGKKIEVHSQVSKGTQFTIFI